jgi:hypothetical protein
VQNCFTSDSKLKDFTTVSLGQSHTKVFKSKICCAETQSIPLYKKFDFHNKLPQQGSRRPDVLISTTTCILHVANVISCPEHILLTTMIGILNYSLRKTVILLAQRKFNYRCLWNFFEVSHLLLTFVLLPSYVFLTVSLSSEVLFPRCTIHRPGAIPTGPKNIGPDIISSSFTLYLKFNSIRNTNP